MFYTAADVSDVYNQLEGTEKNLKTVAGQVLSALTSRISKDCQRRPYIISISLSLFASDIKLSKGFDLGTLQLQFPY